MEWFILAAGAALGWGWLNHRTRAARERFIMEFRFPERIATAVKTAYPHLQQADVFLVQQGLRDYFLLCHDARRTFVAMPSQVVDVAWHEWILFTRNYQSFCRRAFGRFLHHTPAEAMRRPQTAQTGIKVAWRLACLRERISPKTPHRLPLLFVLDSQLAIPDGFKYSLNCKNRPDDEYCAGDIGCGSCGGGGSGDSGCGGGCGGD